MANYRCVAIEKSGYMAIVTVGVEPEGWLDWACGVVRENVQFIGAGSVWKSHPGLKMPSVETERMLERYWVRWRIAQGEGRDG